jgi:fibronectin-binding autotransporter adhesin
MTRTQGDRRSNSSAGKRPRPGQVKSNELNIALILREDHRRRRRLTTSVMTALAGVLPLLASGAAGQQYWDGPNMTPGGVANGRGGSGTWNATNTNWTNQTGTINLPWAGGIAVFGSRGGTGTVTIDAGGVTSQGLRCLECQVVFKGGPMTLGSGAVVDVLQSTQNVANFISFDSNLRVLGDLTKTGNGRLTLSGDTNIAGTVAVQAGIVQMTGANARLTTNGATVTAAIAGTDTYLARLMVQTGARLTSQGGSAGATGGTAGSFYVQRGGLWDAGAGDVVVGGAGKGLLNVYGTPGGTTEIKAGRIVLGASSGGSGKLEIWSDNGAATLITAASVTGGAGGGVVEFDLRGGTVPYDLAPALQSNLSVSLLNGDVRLRGLHDYTGTTTIKNGSLILDGATLSRTDVDVQKGVLAGSGTITRGVTVRDGAELRGQTGQVLTMGGLALNETSKVNVTLGAPSSSALFKVTSGLALNGQLNVTDGGGFAQGSYRLFDYGGTLTNNGLVIASLPTGFNPGDWSIETGTTGQVNLVVPQAGAGEQYWDGSNMTPGGVPNGRGGSGTWNVASTNWTNQAGTINAPWASQKAVFAGPTPTGSTLYNVTIADQVRASGLDFQTGGYSLFGSQITLSPGAIVSAVETTRAQTITLQTTIIGEGDLVKTGKGAVRLLGYTGLQPANRIAGTIDIREGSLEVSGGETSSTGGLIASRTGEVAGATVWGGGSWALGAADLVVGGAGRGALSVTGSEVSTSGKITVGRVILGRDTGGFGTLTIEGNLGANGQVIASEIAGGVGGGEMVFRYGVRSSNPFAPKLTGNLAVSVQSGEVVLSGAHDYTGATEISGTTAIPSMLVLNGATLANTAVNVRMGGTLGGQGTIGGALNLAGGTLRGAAGQVMTVGSLALDQASNVNVALGAPSATRLFNVMGNLTLDGTLNVTDAGSFGQGVYRIFDYGGTLADNGLVVGAMPAGMAGVVQTAIANQVNLVVNGGGGPVDPVLQFWNGSTTTSTGSVKGGAGTWSSGATTNWTDANGTSASAWGSKFAVFQGASGVVTVDGAGVAATGMQFAVDGYSLQGGPMSLTGSDGTSVIRVGDGSAAGAGYTATIASVLGGTGGLTKTDLGTLVLIGANSYGGGTTIAAGILQIGNGGMSGSILGDVTNNGLLRFARSDAVTFAGVISGSGAVETRSGVLILTADSTYSGGTTIGTGATLQLGNGGASGLVAGDVVNNGTLRFARSDAATMAGAISGSGGLQVQSGSLILTGNSSYTGATTIAAGATLQLGNGGGVGSMTSDVANAGTFAFNGAGALAYGGVISGNGLIRQIGSGVTSLTGDASGFTGATQVEAGVLSVNGKLGGTLTVLAGGQLQGIGTVGDVIVAGTIAPGNSIGTLTVGNITFQTGSIYQVEVTANGQSDRIAATGTATINGGSVQVLAGQGNYQPNTTYTILTAAGGRTGSFAGVTSNLAFLAPSLSYDPDNVYLTLTRNTVSFPSIGGTFNQRQAGAGVESLGQSNPIWNAVVQMDAPTAQAAFNQLSGEVHASAKTALYEDSRLVRDGALSRLRSAFGGSVVASSTAQVASLDEACNGEACQADPGTGIAAWAQGFGSWGYTSTNGNAAGLSRSTGGMLVGVDAPLFEVARLGLFGGYSHTTFNVADRQSSGGSDNVHLGAYGGAQWGPIGLRAGLAYTWHNLSTSRSVAFSGFADSLRATYGAGTFQLFGEAGYRFDVGPATFEPFANIAWMSLSTKGFSETGGAAALTSSAVTSNVTTTTLGLRAGSAFTIAGVTGQARGTVGWQHAFTDTTPWASLQLTGGTPFTAAGVPIAQDAALLELGIDVRLSERASIGIGYTGQFAAGSQDQTVRGNLTYRF